MFVTRKPSLRSPTVFDQPPNITHGMCYML